MTGEKLKQILQDNDISGYKLAGLMKMHERSIYGYYGSSHVKNRIIEKVIKATGLERNKFYSEDQIVSEPKTLSGKSMHIGLNVKGILKAKGIKGQTFANGMNYTRQTLYKRLEEREWETGEILLASQVLNVPVSQIKGYGAGQRSFEKDIYEELHKINKLLQAIANEIKSTN